ncbi:EutN/CcmL family microcompartment protein [Micropruina sonneratiae]|uniref:EutN/CcmL family microcompartment protein n=1 Tax=Micropruina sonneratiae TaxID=2986940 RepID=UPI0022278091|nr:EutN/CcmL family microcompartment protein [Micropruina sp. KQZ13P-5]MCW3157262.1 EutN/CcmL family microcompartment protein [Micropruina sp. KQZ13P-5]
MFLAKVRGTVVSTSKDERLVGFKLLVVHRIGVEGEYVTNPSVAVDTVGAGVGETVIVTGGSSARFAATRPDAPIDLTIVGIVDTVEIGPA